MLATIAKNQLHNGLLSAWSKFVRKKSPMNFVKAEILFAATIQ